MSNATVPSRPGFGLTTATWIIILAVLLVILAAAAVYFG